jgi:AcrR family transcriptional regulator
LSSFILGGDGLPRYSGFGLARREQPGTDGKVAAVTDVAHMASEAVVGDEPRTAGEPRTADEPRAAGEPRAAETNRERVSRRQVDKFAERRAQLADAALQTLAELGYARTSLREIAQNTTFSHGVLHYYFSDKQDLITHCVRQYEAACVTRYDEIVAAATSADQLRREFSAAMAQTLRTDAPMHRLWYDLRNQSLFEESFRADVLEIDQRREAMIWSVVSRYAELAGISAGLSPAAAYAILDGLFQQALLHHLAGDEAAAGDLTANVLRVLDTVQGPAAP